eukprot:scaffold21612_cov69-Phaeocystis_antarctica.AAC.4
MANRIVGISRPQIIVGLRLELWRLTWPEAQGAARRLQIVPACLRLGRAGVACGARQSAAEREGRRSLEARRKRPRSSDRDGSTARSAAPRGRLRTWCRPRHRGKGICHRKCRMPRCRRCGSDRARGKHRISRLASQRVPSSNVALSHREAPSRGKQGHGGESEADQFATHVIVIARLAADLVFSCGSVVKRPCRAAAVVVAHGTTALSLLSNLARLATEGVRRVVARSTDLALAAARERLVRAISARITRALACDRLDGARSAWCLLLAACWRKVARVGLRALTGIGEVGGPGVRALRARQRHADALGAVRARLAGNAHVFALVGLVRAGRALDARGLALDGLNGTGAALGLLGAACWRVEARFGLDALRGAAQVDTSRVRALLARQRRARAKRAVVALCARYRDSCCVF